MKPFVDRDLCIGCGLCTTISEDVFELDDESLAAVVGEVTDENHDSVVEAIENCPVGAIGEE